MQKTKYIWFNGKMVPWQKAKVHVLSHTLHYGSGVFEGTRAYETPRGPAIFRLEAHNKRLFYSAAAVKMAVPYSEKEFFDATIETVRINKVKACYIRPLIYFGYGTLRVNPAFSPVEAMIACWPWEAYLPHDLVNIKTSTFRRISPQTTVADAKLTGNYLNSIFSILQLRGTLYHEALFLDTDGFVAEGPGENIFLVKKNTLYTPKLGNILAGITRDTIIKIACKHGIEVKEQNITLEEAYSADEAFFTGTAAEITPIRSIDDQVIGKGAVGKITTLLREDYMNLVRGLKVPSEFADFLTYVGQ